MRARRTSPPVLAALCAAICALCLLPACAVPSAHLPPLTPVEIGRPGPRAAAPAPDQPLKVTLAEAVLMALDNNRALRVERLSPSIRGTFEEEERAAFDPVFSAEAEAGAAKVTGPGKDASSASVNAGASVSQFLPTGTTVEAGVSTARTDTSATRPISATRAGLSVTQALLRGRGRDVNLASLRQARLDTQFTRFELRGFAEGLVAQVEATYWDYVLALRRVEIFDGSLALAQQQLEETQQRIRVGSLAETELAAAEAEVALRREALINAHGEVDTLRVRLLRLVRPSALAGSVRELTPETVPAVPPPDEDALPSHVEVALKMRPDLNQARLQLQIGDLELVKTRNGLLPRMDLFISLGKTGYARSFGGSVGAMPGDAYDAAAGLTFELPVGNRLARARRQRAVLTRSQLDEGLRNVEDLVREDVEAAYIETGRALQQVTATAATRRLQEEKVRAETAKFRVGKSTALLVAATQSDLVTSQVAEVESVTTYLKALTNLYLLEGSLLARRGIEAPGSQAVEGD